MRLEAAFTDDDIRKQIMEKKLLKLPPLEEMSKTPKCIHVILFFFFFFISVIKFIKNFIFNLYAFLYNYIYLYL
jgi:hypothetical protein